jgi:hypothetical protein
MTQEEKAKELFDKFYSAIPNDEMGENYNSAKQCALIAVDEILEICSLDCLTNLHNHEFEAKFNYWQEVKQEIEKL